MAAGTVAIESALKDMCSTSKSFLMMIIIISVALSIIPLLAGAGLFFFKKENKNLKLAGMVLLAIGALLIICAIFGVIIYVLSPGLVSSLTGGTTVNC